MSSAGGNGGGGTTHSPSPPSQDVRAGVAERWISSQAAGTTPTNPSLSQSNSPKASANPSPKGPPVAGAAAWTNKSPPSASLGAPVASAIPLMSSSYNFGSALGESSLGSLSAFGGPAGGGGGGGGAAALSSPFPQSASSGFGSGFGVYNGSVAALPSSTTGISSSPQYTFQLPGTGMKDSLIRSPSYNNYSHKVTKSKITPRQVSFDSKSIQSGGLARFHQAQSDSKDSPKEAFSETTSSSSENHYPSAGNEKLYEAYNDLHSLAQDFHKPFDAPAIVVVGHQTDGKSALIEALMGFQFNHVGGGTKTRRPITLHMNYNALCSEPRCFLITEDMPPIEEEKRLEELQAYIQAENMRLEHEACQFWAKEIILKIEYKYCPNLTIIDTPGLIAAAPGQNNHALQMQGRAVEALVRTKMQHKEFIILCLEDCSDWSNATTRRIVMQVDPELSRTVIVSTKLDTRIPQFASRADVELFLRPPQRLLDRNILGGAPFFTSVPSGRVGSNRDSVYQSNDHFREAVALREKLDVASLEEKLDRPLSNEERSRVGVSQLRWFLEQLLRRRYMDSVPAIVPLLDREYRNASIRLHRTIQELSDLDAAKLKEKGRIFRDSFLSKLSLLLRGTVAAPVEKFGETLQDERVHGGTFVSTDSLQMPFKQIPNAGMRLYGGAQYHRAMAEFRFLVGGVKCPILSREEIVNACGVEDIHDGTNYYRTACVIAVAKARDIFEPSLLQLGMRLSHIIRRLLPISLYLLQKDGEYLSGHEMFIRHVATAFHIFVESTERNCREKCMEDLLSTTRYVTWSLHNKNRAGLRHYLDTVGSSELAVGAVAEGSLQPVVGNSNKQDNKVRPEVKSNSSSVIEGSQTPQARLVDLLENTLWSRKLAPSSEEIVNALVAQIFGGIRDHCAACAEMKFNCFFLMPVVDAFPAMLRENLETSFEEDIDHVFDVAQVRHALLQQQSQLDLELHRVERLQEKFANIHHHLSSSQGVLSSPKDVTEEMSMFKIS
ncbi:unnamed protein product [Sphagnum tenellum]